MTAKAEAVAELEGKIAALTASLEEARGELATKSSAVDALEVSKKETEEQLAALQAALDEAKSQRDGDVASLEAVRTEVCDI